MNPIDWVKEKKKFQDTIGDSISSTDPITSRFINVEEMIFPESINDKCFEGDSYVRKVDAIVVHLNHLVLFAIPSPFLCNRIFQVAEGMLGLELTLSNQIAEIIMDLSNNSKDAWLRGTLNFGLTEFQQDDVKGSDSKIFAVGGKLFQLSYEQVDVD